jgi:hypothetical protein
MTRLIAMPRRVCVLYASPVAMQDSLMQWSAGIKNVPVLSSLRGTNLKCVRDLEHKVRSKKETKSLREMCIARLKIGCEIRCEKR